MQGVRVCESRGTYYFNGHPADRCGYEGRYPVVGEYAICIYGLRRRGEERFRYVGSTRRPCERLCAHWQSRIKGIGPRCDWLRELERIGQWPELVVLEMTTDARRWLMEHRWICFLRNEGHPLTNRAERVPPQGCRCSGLPLLTALACLIHKKTALPSQTTPPANAVRPTPRDSCHLPQKCLIVK